MRALFISLLAAALYCAPVFGSDVEAGGVSLADSDAEAFSFEREDSAIAVLYAFKLSYPDDIKTIGYDADECDWYLRSAKGTIFYWARGRLLTKSKKNLWANYKPYVFYDYPSVQIDPASISPAAAEYLRSENFRGNRGASYNHDGDFYGELYGGLTRAQIESNITRTDFLGRRVSVHKKILPALKRVESKLIKLAEFDETISDFIESIRSVDGYNWRLIGDNGARSNHSWGFAIDIMPRRQNRFALYWYWESFANEQWMLTPLSRRWNPPQSVIDAFEREGFIWGGYWELWDNMHFEYRPELIVLRGVEEANPF